MSEVKRYDAGCDYAGEDEMVERIDGDYVKYNDYAELKAQRDGLAAENAVMLELLTDISEQYQEVQTESEENAAVIDLDYISEVNTYVSRDVDGENPFSATDAYLNSVRAEGVRLFAAAVQGGCAVGDRVKDLADTFATQLRAGEPS